MCGLWCHAQCRNQLLVTCKFRDALHDVEIGINFLTSRGQAQSWKAKTKNWGQSWPLVHLLGIFFPCVWVYVCAPSAWELWGWRYSFSHHVGVRKSPGSFARVIKSLNLWVSSLAPHRFLSSMIFVVTSIRSICFFYLFFHEFFDIVIKHMCFFYIQICISIINHIGKK